MTLNARSEAVRRRLLRPWNFRLYLWARLPLAACAGLSLRRDYAVSRSGFPAAADAESLRSILPALPCRRDVHRRAA